MNTLPGIAATGGSYADGALLMAVAEMQRGWIVLRNCRLADNAQDNWARVSYALLHPRVGIVLLDVLPGSVTRGAPDLLRRMLEAAGFRLAFGDCPPIVHLCMTSSTLPGLQPMLAREFDARRPLALSGGDAWVGAAQRVLTTEQPLLVPTSAIRALLAGLLGRNRFGHLPALRPALGLRGLAVFWGAVSLAFGSGALVLQLLGPPEKPSATMHASASVAEPRSPQGWPTAGQRDNAWPHSPQAPGPLLAVWPVERVPARADAARADVAIGEADAATAAGSHPGDDRSASAASATAGVDAVGAAAAGGGRDLAPRRPASSGRDVGTPEMPSSIVSRGLLLGSPPRVGSRGEVDDASVHAAAGAPRHAPERASPDARGVVLRRVLADSGEEAALPGDSEAAGSDASPATGSAPDPARTAAPLPVAPVPAGSPSGEGAATGATVLDPRAPGRPDMSGEAAFRAELSPDPAPLPAPAASDAPAPEAASRAAESIPMPRSAPAADAASTRGESSAASTETAAPAGSSQLPAVTRSGEPRAAPQAVADDTTSAARANGSDAPPPSPHPAAVADPAQDAVPTIAPSGAAEARSTTVVPVPGDDASPDARARPETVAPASVAHPAAPPREAASSAPAQPEAASSTPVAPAESARALATGEATEDRGSTQAPPAARGDAALNDGASPARIVAPVQPVARVPVARPTTPEPGSNALVQPENTERRVPAPTAPTALVEALIARGDAMVARHDISAARLLYERAAAGNARAAAALARTYDPAFLAEIGARGIRGDAALAAAWYRKANSLGDASALARVEALNVPDPAAQGRR